MKHWYWVLSMVMGALLMAWGCTSDGPGVGQPGSGGSGGAGALVCASGQLACGNTCVDPATNSAHCGACGRACTGGMVCAGSNCVCQPGFSNCNGVCVNVTSDAQNCGSCGVTCGVTQGCTASACSCPAGSLACGQSCVDSMIDVNNCGTCGTVCQTGQLCQGGACTCLSGRTSCNGACVDTMSDPANCGTCGTVCPASAPFCSLGVCSTSCAEGLTACATTGGTACVDVTSDEGNCGACGTTCAAGQECSGSACGCPAGQTACGGQCVNTQTDVNNCGACGTVCMGGQACSEGMCTCPTPGTAFCNGQCRDTTSDPTNCGPTCAVCGTGQTCQSGVCACPAGQVPCEGACVPDGQCGGTGGSGGGGGSGGSGGAPPTPVDLNCGNWYGAAVNVAAADVISDFDQTTPIMYQTGVRGGTEWYAYGAQDSDSTKGASTPGVGSNAFTIDTTTPGPCNSGGSLKVSSPGNDNGDVANGWGVGFGVNLMGDVPDVTPPKKDLYDAQAAGYTGIGFFMKCQQETDFIYLKVVDGPNDADIVNPTCSYSSGTICNQFGTKNVTATTDWTYHRVYFAEALQDWEPTTISTGSVAANALTAFQIQVNTKYTRDGGSRVKNPFTCWVDDVHFLKDQPPRQHANVAPKSCTTGTAAPGGYYTNGNRIYDCKNGQAKVFKGIARPSLEWDRAGWNITYEDLYRIRQWGSNIVRFSLNQVFWLDSSSKGGLYRRTVDRAVKWSLALGMDVILDLHWTGSGTDYGQKNMPNRQGIDFWTSVANTYENDGRVIFELYNEPFGVSPTVWRNGDGSWAGMQEMYTAVRNAGANNLVLVGGLDYAYRLDEVLPAQALTGSNIAYVTHPYQFKAGDANAWNGAFGNLAADYPVFATEFGQANINEPGGSQTCNSGFYTSIIDYFNASPRFMSWTAWAWHVERQISNANDTCGFPQLITQYSGVTNPAGTVVKQKLSQ